MTDQTPDPTELREPSYEELIGLVTIGSSSLDHALRILHAVTTVDGDPDRNPWDALDMNLNRKSLSKDTRAGWLVWQENGAFSTAAMTAGSDWIQATLALLERRDHVVHALWKVDPELPEGFSGRYLRTNRVTPDLAATAILADDIRTHLADNRLRAVWDAITETRLGNAGTHTQ